LIQVHTFTKVSQLKDWYELVGFSYFVGRKHEAGVV